MFSIALVLGGVGITVAMVLMRKHKKKSKSSDNSGTKQPVNKGAGGGGLDSGTKTVGGVQQTLNRVSNTVTRPKPIHNQVPQSENAINDRLIESVDMQGGEIGMKHRDVHSTKLPEIAVDENGANGSKTACVSANHNLVLVAGRSRLRAYQQSGSKRSTTPTASASNASQSGRGRLVSGMSMPNQSDVSGIGSRTTPETIVTVPHATFGKSDRIDAVPLVSTPSLFALMGRSLSMTQPTMVTKRPFNASTSHSSDVRYVVAQMGLVPHVEATCKMSNLQFTMHCDAVHMSILDTTSNDSATAHEGEQRDRDDAKALYATSIMYPTGDSRPEMTVLTVLIPVVLQPGDANDCMVDVTRNLQYQWGIGDKASTVECRIESTNHAMEVLRANSEHKYSVLADRVWNATCALVELGEGADKHGSVSKSLMSHVTLDLCTIQLVPLAHEKASGTPATKRAYLPGVSVTTPNIPVRTCRLLRLSAANRKIFNVWGIDGNADHDAAKHAEDVVTEVCPNGANSLSFVNDTSADMGSKNTPLESAARHNRMMMMRMPPINSRALIDPVDVFASPAATRGDAVAYAGWIKTAKGIVAVQNMSSRTSSRICEFGLYDNQLHTQLGSLPAASDCTQWIFVMVVVLKDRVVACSSADNLITFTLPHGRTIDPTQCGVMIDNAPAVVLTEWSHWSLNSSKMMANVGRNADANVRSLYHMATTYSETMSPPM